METTETQRLEPVPADVEAPSVLDPTAWVDRYSDYLFRYAFSRLREANAAEEVVQETFLSGVRYAEQFSGRGTERAWLLGILKRKIIDFVRLRDKHAASSPYQDEIDLTAQLFDATGNWKPGALGWTPAPGQKIELSELWSVVKGCLKTLPASQADVFMLSVVEEMNSEDICEQLGISSSNFWVRMHRARLGLAACVGKKWEEE
ncbi:MAG: sigma-70 family RNA polymerase sigma factor [Planctomycetota bacterium]